MPKQVVTGAIMQCSMGTTPASFIATPKQITSSFMDAGNIMDHKSITNIPPFGLCRSLANPSVAAATAAAQGKLTPMPCVPATPAPWVPGSPTVLDASFPALNNVSCLNCTWAGVIKFTTPGQFTHNIP